MKSQQLKPIIDRMVIEELNKRKAEIEKVGIAAITATFLVVLHDKYGWEKDQLNKIVQQTTEQFLSVRDKFVSIDDFIRWCAEFGIEGVV